MSFEPWMRNLLFCGAGLLASVAAAQPTSAPATAPTATTAPATVPTTTAPAATAPTSMATSAPATSRPSWGGAGASRFTRTARPQGAETTSGASFAPSAMPREYGVLLARSIFTKGRPPRENTGASEGGGWRPSTPPLSAEHHLIFNGITIVDGRPLAFIEDTSSGKVTTLKDGDRIAGGTVRHITFDALDFELGGRSTHVAIGETLAGGVAVIPSTGPSGPTTLGGATTQGSAGGGDVLERLRQRRLQEIGGKK